MSLSQLVDNKRTDKNTVHSYLDLYERLLSSKKISAKYVLEVGVGDGHQGVSNGGSIKLWADYFQNATIHALDIKHIKDIWTGIKENPRIVLHTSINAYNELYFNRVFLNPGMRFDFLLDDGPHTLESQKDFIRLYSQIMADDGVLIVEDIQKIEWIEELKEVTPDHLKQYIEIYDLRSKKGRYDDIVFVINKSGTR